ncbi:hypothetical protein Purlil1_3902 [Purpureocillium lilacinum]|uniref:Uncharacterized protein n=1 Tax=Purpureocillium lilacinum TaxID=33203 RepID=A0ABR0C5A2_PURLI|nr:hypothetical protein Purlil1_3902 [Purpureocillium lilacinum]
MVHHHLHASEVDGCPQPTAHSPSEAKRGTEITARGSTRSPNKTYQAEELNGPAATLSSRRQVPSARRARDLRRTGSPKRRAVLGGAAALWSRGHGRCEPNERANRLGSRTAAAQRFSGSYLQGWAGPPAVHVQMLNMFMDEGRGLDGGEREREPKVWVGTHFRAGGHPLFQGTSRTQPDRGATRTSGSGAPRANHRSGSPGTDLDARPGTRQGPARTAPHCNAPRAPDVVVVPLKSFFTTTATVRTKPAARFGSWFLDPGGLALAWPARSVTRTHE